MENKTQPDLQALALTKAIRQKESGGNYNAVGDAGTSTGAYQYQKATWNAYSKQVLGVDNAPMTPENQNAVTYGMIKTWKDGGLGPAEIAAKWNSGSEKGWENKVGTTTINGKPIQYNVPQYVSQVVNNFKQIYPQVQSQFQPQQTQPMQQVEQPQKSFLQKATDVVTSIFPGEKVGEAIGTLAGYVASPNKDYYDLSAPSPLQTTADVAQGALMVGTSLPGAVNVFGKTVGGVASPLAKTAVGRVVQNTALGGAFGLTGAVAEGDNMVGVAKQTGIGALTGGVVGTVAEGINAAVDKLPRRLVNQALPQLKQPETIDYAIGNIKLGKIETMVDASKRALDSYDNQVTAVLRHPEFDGVMVTIDDVIPNTLSSFPNAEYSTQTILQKMKSQLPAMGKLITKLEKQGISIEEANTLRKATDKITYKTIIDSPEVKAGKDIAEAFGNTLRSIVQNTAEETKPIFSNYSKEINLYKALKKLEGKTNRGSFVKMKDLLSGGLGGMLAGPGGSVAGVALEKITESPITKIAAAKAITAVKPTIKGTVEATKRLGTSLPGTIRN